MAEQSGVVNSTSGGGGNARAALPGGRKGKNRMLWIGGAIGGLFLLASHKGSSSTAANGAANVQAASDALAAQEAAQANLATDPASFSPAGVPVDTGGGSYTQQGPSATTSPAVDLTIDTATPAGAGDGGATAAPAAPVDTTQAAAGKSAKPRKFVPTKKGRKPAHKGGGGGGGAHKGGGGGGAHKGGGGGGPAPHPSGGGGGPAPHPKEPPKGKPAPAVKQPNAKGSPQHPETKKKTPSGAKKHSPVMVESVDGFGSGVTVMGRTFPGATGHRMGPPRIDGNGNLLRDVTVEYGGHCETHTCHGNGRIWTDRTAGKNPPSRGVPVANDPIAI